MILSLVNIMALATSMTADAVVLATTLYATYGIKQLISQTSMKISVTMLLLRDGTIYFSVLLALNITYIIIYFLNVYISIGLFFDVFTSILISHLFLNLRQVHLVQGHLSSELSQTSDLQFASRIVGNLGAPLNHGSPLSDHALESEPGFALDVSITNALQHDQTGGAIEWDDIEEIPQVVKEPLKEGLGLSDTNTTLEVEHMQQQWLTIS
ncbi:hypothetical protein AcV7_003580 [Taiwanofungus camphoratus]|nr:hypothetical protein AcV7_003580 [Antrodia cinnamomea]